MVSMSIDLFRKKLSKKVNETHGNIVIVADKDGVLCPPHGKIEPLQEIIDIVKAGGIFVVISGASMDRAKGETIKPLLDAVGKNTKYLENIYLILNNGAGIYRFKTNKYECIFRKEIKDEIGEQGVAKAIDILKETRERFAEIKKTKEQYPEIKQINNEEIQIVLRTLGKMKNDELRKRFDPHGEKRRTWAAYIRKRFSEENINLHVSVDGTSSINILVPGINKGSGIGHLAEKLHVDNSALLYLGDNFHENRNDRIAVEDRIDLTVNFGKDMMDGIKGTTLINSVEKGTLGAGLYLKIIYEVLLEKK